MARLSTVPFIFFLILTCHAQSFEARKFLSLEKKENPSLKDNTTPLYHRVGEGHAIVLDTGFIISHLSKIDRILRSVPSPGTGN
ncbi:hypothetical protein NC652_004042 [Populus alba x Populus x berolinensis]|nr:hypothetical protein NC652_004042 [Populus alba x Populus x berolinensis]